MVLHTMKFMNSFPRKGALKHYPPSAIMNGVQLHMTWLQLKFGSYFQVAEDVTPHNSLAARTHGGISMGPLGDLSGEQRFLVLDTGNVRNCWKNFPCLWLLLTGSMCLVILNVFFWCSLNVMVESLAIIHLMLAKLVIRMIPLLMTCIYLCCQCLPNCQECFWLNKEVLIWFQEWICLPLLTLFPSPQQWIWVVLKLTPSSRCRFRFCCLWYDIG